MNGWHRLWILLAVIYAAVIGGLAFSAISRVRPTVSASTLRHISNETLIALAETPAPHDEPTQGVDDRVETRVVNGFTVEVPAKLKEDEKKKIAQDIYDAVQIELNIRKWKIAGMHVILFLAPVIIIPVIGYAVTWVIRGFREKNSSRSLPRSDKIRLMRVLIDVGITYGLSLLGGFVIGAVSAMAHQPRSIIAIGVSNILCAIAGFAISGYFTTKNRWLHLLLVAFGLWLTGLVNLAFGFSLVQWFFGIFVILLAMGIGGGIASLLKKKNPDQ